NSFFAKIPLMAVPRRPHPTRPTVNAELACAPRTDSGFTIVKPSEAAADSPDPRRKSLRLGSFFMLSPCFVTPDSCFNIRIGCGLRLHTYTMKLSILMPVYNERTMVERCIAGVLAAPVPENMERELVIVDDRSTDGTSDILDRIA